VSNRRASVPGTGIRLIRAGLFRGFGEIISSGRENLAQILLKLRNIKIWID
jgi:hypothetical protein